jgi:MFS family permease
MPAPDPPTRWQTVALMAAALLAVTMGIRQSLGLFVKPLDGATGLGIASISLAMAVGQFVWGAVQPVAGAVSDRYGPGRVLAVGVLVAALGSALTPLMSSSLGLMFSIGVLASSGFGAGSFSVLIGAAAQRLRPSERGMASGFINAGGSFGQFIFAPLTQLLISRWGWKPALWSLALMTLGALPLARSLRKPLTAAEPRSSEGGLARAVKDAFGNGSYLLLHAGFMTCGFHIAFLVTHLPIEVTLCGLPASVASWSLALIGLFNVVGSIATGAWIGRHRSKYVLFWMYASRSLLILLYMVAPKHEWTFYVFAASLGFTWLATVPPTASLVGKLFGTRYLSTLFGLTLLSHQIGGFFGAWLGGIAVERLGNYSSMWYADAILAAIAALLNVPIREAKLTAQPSAAA